MHEEELSDIYDEDRAPTGEIMFLHSQLKPVCSKVKIRSRLKAYFEKKGIHLILIKTIICNFYHMNKLIDIY